MNKISKQRIQEFVLIALVVLLPFNLLIGILIPSLVSLPLYVVDIFLLLLGVLLLLGWRKNKALLTSEQKQIAFLLFLFVCFGILTILFNKTALLQFIDENSKQVVVHSMFKQIISDDPTQSINKTIQIFLSLFLFLAISVSSLKKELLLKIACLPLALILFTNIYLVVNQEDVILDGGREGVTIHPYGIKEIGRTYFPFVNSLLLSMYLSLLFFVVLLLFFKNYNEKKKRNKIIFSMLLFLLILVLGFTKGRAALTIVFVLFLFLPLFNSKYNFVSPFPKLFFLMTGTFLFVMLLSSFFTISFPNILGNISHEQKIALENDGELGNDIELENHISVVRVREADVDTVNAGRMSLHWPTALTLFSSEQFFGVGTGMFFYSVVLGKKELLCETKDLCSDLLQPSDVSSTAHSIYLQILAENGIAGFALFAAMIGSILVFAHKINKKATTATLDLCSFFILFAFVAFLLQGIFFSYFEYREMSYLFWLVVGLLFKE